ncbi:AAA family ATPase [Cryptosporangium aurantiacum]|uniref:C-terminal, D2-small domain-containing protein, of ClpB protein n=1 Tax=Cryptosporangium aurantiacum TaxID=134849 RepID=A0A1M7R0N4_9ACTN|nr:AAA family ATPase [Cryptosporangium aurantiacum]SHN38262.1 C-terminal, D2-small domain-containing protein, of ClpB protein [Cryptosporangium aurantiacum]
MTMPTVTGNAVTGPAPAGPALAGSTGPETRSPVGGRSMPAWLREVSTSLSINAQLVLYGNIHDRFLLPGQASGWELCTLPEALRRALRPAGFEFLIVADAVSGLSVYPETPENTRLANEALHGTKAAFGRRPELGELAGVLERATAASIRCAVLVNYASHLVPDVARLETAEYDFFARCDRLSHETHPRILAGHSAPLFNPIIWAISHERDLPTWLTAGNEDIRTVAVPLPDLAARQSAAEWLSRQLVDAEAGDDRRRQAAAQLADQTQGMTMRSMVAITRLARRLGTGPNEIDEAVRCYRVGVHDNPWRQEVLRNRLNGAPEIIAERVRGQDEAIRHSVDILVRAVLGLSGAHTGGGARPRGVLFFAGPTGVGKTELAKEITRLVFGDETAYTRFDMSEFSAEHAADRLIGAPPGYVGHDAGGELTNAVRQRPFSLLLFDEVEKAHPRILDKFLQILDDGRLTEATGSTVYFSETILVFTSNLGISAEEYAAQASGTALPRTELERRVRGEVEHHFSNVLGRPELLNRLGDNIVVFNFIDDRVAAEILDLLLQHVKDRLRHEHHLELRLHPAVRERLLDEARKQLGFGGRGIGSLIESALVNPVSRILFEQPPAAGTVLAIADLELSRGTWRVVLG